MSKIYFNPETGGFHHEKVDGARQIPAPQTRAEIKAGKRPVMIDNPACRIPATAVEVSADRFAELMAAQAQGKRIIEAGGKPVAVDPKPDVEEGRRRRRLERNRRLAASDWTQLPDAPIESATRLAWAEYRAALRDLDIDAADWPTEPGSAG